MHGHMLVVLQHIPGTIFGGDASQLVLVLEFLSGDHFWWGCWKTCHESPFETLLGLVIAKSLNSVLVAQVPIFHRF